MLALSAALALALAAPGVALAGGKYYCPPKPPPEKEKCNSGRGNGFEGVMSSSTYTPPSTGSAGSFPSADCDPGNSGAVNRGGD